METYIVKKVDNKLVLTSNNINTGDKVHYRHTKGIYFERDCIYVDEGEVGNPTGRHYIKDKDDYNHISKVIGEISPDALSYVKEGDEFDTQDIRIIYDCEKGNECDIIFRQQTCLAPHQLLQPIKIKGPCGHLH